MEGERPGRRRNIDGARSKLQPPVLSDDGRLDPTIRAVTPLRPATTIPYPAGVDGHAAYTAIQRTRLLAGTHPETLKQLPNCPKTRLIVFPPQRNLPARGFRPATLLGAAGAIMIYGWYKLTLGIREQK